MNDSYDLLVIGAGTAAMVASMRVRAAGDAHADWRELMAFKRSFTDPVPEKNEARYADKGIDAFRNPDKMAVFYLPSYSPELNPEERLNANLKRVIRSKVPVRT